MGMFDELYDADGHDWQTKAYDCQLTGYEIGSVMPPLVPPLPTYQVEILGDPDTPGAFVDSLATVTDGALSSLPDERDDNLPQFDYFGHLKGN